MEEEGEVVNTGDRIVVGGRRKEGERQEEKREMVGEGGDGDYEGMSLSLRARDE